MRLRHKPVIYSKEAIKSTLSLYKNTLPNNCWEWLRYKDKRGRGQIRLKDNNTWYVSILSAYAYLDFNPEISDLYVLHKCDNPSCFNPEHLFLGTQEDNQLDKCTKGRHHAHKQTHCTNGHEFTPENTNIFNGRRNCKICRNRSSKSYHLRQKIRNQNENPKAITNKAQS